MKIISLQVLTPPVLSQTEKHKAAFIVTSEKKHNVREAPTVSKFNWFNNLSFGSCEINFDDEHKELSIAMDTSNPENLIGIALHGHLGMVVTKWIMELIQPICSGSLKKHPCPDLYSMWIDAILETQKHVFLKIFPLSTGPSEFVFKVTELVEMEQQGEK